MILTCPKCDAQLMKRDNFCEECGKDLRLIKLKQEKNDKKKKRSL